jgi:hypothetical protein
MGEDQPLTGGLDGSVTKQSLVGKLVGGAQIHQDLTDAGNQSPKRYEGMESMSQSLEWYYFYLCMQIWSGLCSTPSCPLGACRRLWGSALQVCSESCFLFYFFSIMPASGNKTSIFYFSFVYCLLSALTCHVTLVNCSMYVMNYFSSVHSFLRGFLTDPLFEAVFVVWLTICSTFQQL